jgi:2-methylcitrate dehydratase PrpD
VTQPLASFAAGLDAGALPDPVVHEASRALVDWLAVTIAGADRAPADALCGVLVRAGGSGIAPLVGRAERLSPVFAALANGFAAHLEDFDDTYNPPETTIHGSAPLWPAIAAIAAGRPMTGADALAGFVAGFELQARVGRAAGPGHYEIGWHVTGTVGHLGAAAATARVLGLPAAVTARALGLAGTQSAGVKESYGTDGKALHAGKAASDGLLAALLAADGLTGSPTIVEGERGLLRVLAPEPDPSQLLDGLGTTWHLLENGYKAYPSGSLTHPAMDAILALRAAHGFKATDVRLVEARVHPYAATVTGKVDPATGLAAKFSLTHSAGVALVHDRPSTAHFSDAGARDPEVVRARNLVEVIGDAGLSKRGATVTITLHDGRVLREEVADNRGVPGNPLSDDDLAGKYLEIAGPRLGEASARRLLDRCWALPSISDFGRLVEGASRP